MRDKIELFENGIESVMWNCYSVLNNCTISMIDYLKDPMMDVIEKVCHYLN